MEDKIRQVGQWAWARWRDFNDVRDLFDLLGLKTAFVAMLGGLGSYAWLYEPGHRPLAVIAICLVVIAICAISIAFQKQLNAVDGSPWYKRWFLGEPEFTPLHDAVVKVFSQSHKRGGGLAKKAIDLSGLASDHTITKGDEAQICNWMATEISKKVTIFGVRSSSNIRERFSYPDSFKAHYFTEGASVLRHILYGETAYYTGLTVRTAELNRYLNDLQSNDT